MLRDQFRIYYPALEEIASRFSAQAEAQEGSLQRVVQSLQILQNGSWQGDAANAFFAEMEQLTFAFRRLITALQEGNALTQTMMHGLRAGEEDAARVFLNTDRAMPSVNATSLPSQFANTLTAASPAPENQAAHPNSLANAPHPNTVATSGPNPANANLTISQGGLDFIMQREGFRARPYEDQKGHATIGYGHLLHKGPVNEADLQRFPEPLDQEAAREILRQDVNRFANAIRQGVRVPLNQHQFDALLSFAFNVGAPAFRKSTLLRELNQGNYEKVPYEMSRWTDDGNARKIERRTIEGRMFASGEYP